MRSISKRFKLCFHFNLRREARAAAAVGDMDGAPQVSLHGVLREWQLGRLDRTSTAQMECFLGNHKSYGEAGAHTRALLSSTSALFG